MNVGLPVPLSRCYPGDLIALSPRGVQWTVIHRRDGTNLNSVIQIQSERSTRTYCDKDRRWSQEVILIQPAER